MIQLSFNQKVGFGFAIIILLLVTSGLSSLWNLNDISGSTSRVNESAVPVVKESNGAQIQLLKLAKLSSLAFNARRKERIQDYRQRFEDGVAQFNEQYRSIEALAKNDPDMSALVIGVKSNYDLYRYAVDEMFEAKLGLIAEREIVEVQAEEIVNQVDTIGGALLEITYYSAPEEFEEQMVVVAGYTEQAEIYSLGIIKTVEEIKASQDIGRLSEGGADLQFALDNSRRYYQSGADQFKEFDDQGLVEIVDQAYKDLEKLISQSPSISDHKILELEQTKIALDKLAEADAAVSQSVEGLDELLSSADSLFNSLQSEVISSLDFGFKSSIVMLIILVLLAAQNFNSMRQAIAKKMIDLAKLNKIGGTLAAAQSQNSALEEVLQSMHEKIGVAQGSVYLMNEANKLEVKAYFPPKAIDSDSKPAQFKMGEGIIGRAAETKKVIFVPNTARDDSFVTQDGDNPRALICVPLIDKDMLVGVINLSGDVKSVAFADSDYEFVSSVARSLVTTVKNIRMREVIEEQNRNLEAKVEKRTAALNQKNKDIASMMANMHQGLFTITPGGLIHKEYAAYLETIFETDRIADRNFSDLLFANTMAGSDAVDQNITAVDAIVGEDEMMFDFNSHCLLTEMSIKFDDDREKILEMAWDPIINDADEVDKLMVTVRDVTALKALEAEAEGQKRELEIIGEILAVDARKFSDFLETSKAFISGCRSIIESTPSKDMDVVAELFRNMHTVKGNARTYGLNNVTNIVHEVESTYDALRKEEDKVWDPEALLAELNEAEVIVDRYGFMFNEKLGRGGDAAAGQNVVVDAKRVSGWLDKIKSIAASAMDDNVKDVVAEAYQMIVRLGAKPLSDVLSDVVALASSLADQLGKAKPNVVIDDANIFIEESGQNILNNIFMHVFRNAMDHGIESIEERQAKGKPEQGSITLDTEVGDNAAVLSVRDDGRGIAVSKIYEMAIEKGLYSADDARPEAKEIANLIFSSGFSTAEEVTDVSGRGVGMDAVKGFLEEQGGSIEIILDDGNDTDDFRAFTTKIVLPSKFYIEALDFAQSA